MKCRTLTLMFLFSFLCLISSLLVIGRLNEHVSNHNEINPSPLTTKKQILEEAFKILLFVSLEIESMVFH